MGEEKVSGDLIEIGSRRLPQDPSLKSNLFAGQHAEYRFADSPPRLDMPRLELKEDYEDDAAVRSDQQKQDLTMRKQQEDTQRSSARLQQN